MRLELEPVRGMRDIVEPDSKYIEFIINTFKRVAELYGYEYVIPPTIERFRLFAMKSGPEIEKSMYVFKDKAGREVCLRPEFTAGIVRVYLRNFLARPKPVKVYYAGQVFRYEEPQHGRYREFFQAGVEYIGNPNLDADIEQILLLRDFYKAINLDNFEVKIGTIGIIRGLLTLWGVPEREQDLIIHFIDKKEFNSVKSMLSKYRGSNIELLNSIMEFKTRDPQELLRFSKELGLGNLDESFDEEVRRISVILDVCRRVGINAFVDLGFARGLAYYTGFIFEIIVPNFNLSIAGGGRYDKLIELYGGPKTPAVGFSIGVDRTAITLQKSNVKLPETFKRVMLIMLVNDYVLADAIASKLRNNNYSVLTRFVPKSRLSDLIGLASRLNYDYVVIVGQKEVSEGKVAIKNLSSKVQKLVTIDELDYGINI